jgi:hypothetical protein
MHAPPHPALRIQEKNFKNNKKKTAIQKRKWTEDMRVSRKLQTNIWIY